MAYFAEIDEIGTVLRVISVSNTDAPDPAPSHSEPLGRAFIADVLGLSGTWVQTSYNGSFRKQYAPVGGTFLAGAGVFVWPQPYSSWTLDANYDWQPPVPYPSGGGRYIWNEQIQEWEPA